MSVHLYRHPCHMEALRALADRHGLLMIEDAAHAIEATYRGRKMGVDSAAVAFSFYATKNITAGEGGMLITPRKDLAERAEILRLHGMSRDAWKRHGSEGFRHWDILLPGYKYNLSDVHAAIALAQLPKLEKFWVERQRLWEQYDALMAGLPEVIRPVIRPEVQSAYHLYNIRVKVEKLLWSRDQIMGAIQAENIGLGVHFRALHPPPLLSGALRFSARPLSGGRSSIGPSIFPSALSRLGEVGLRDVVLAVTKVLSVARQHPFRSVAEGCSAHMMP